MRRPEININPKNSGHTTEVLAYFFAGGDAPRSSGHRF